jgi:pterin-4a-carbinolamine dehydratase
MNQTTTTEIVLNPGTDGLKAERIQFAPTVPAGSRLKAERIQLALRDLPGWHVVRGAIVRTYVAEDARQASRILQHVIEIGTSGGELPGILVDAGRVTFVLPTFQTGWIAEPDLALARALEVLG